MLLVTNKQMDQYMDTPTSFKLLNLALYACQINAYMLGVIVGQRFLLP